jgi:hypothetical protein
MVVPAPVSRTSLCLRRVRSTYATELVGTGQVTLYSDRIAAVPENLIRCLPGPCSPQVWSVWERCYILQAQSPGAPGEDDPLLS